MQEAVVSISKSVLMFEEMDIRAADPSLPQVTRLIEVHTAYGDAHYRAESNHHVGADQHEKEGIRLFAAWHRDRCLGIAGLNTLDDESGELKSMHVLEELGAKAWANCCSNASSTRRTGRD